MSKKDNVNKKNIEKENIDRKNTELHFLTNILPTLQNLGFHTSIGTQLSKNYPELEFYYISLSLTKEQYINEMSIIYDMSFNIKYVQGCYIFYKDSYEGGQWRHIQKAIPTYEFNYLRVQEYVIMQIANDIFNWDLSLDGKDKLDFWSLKSKNI